MHRQNPECSSQNKDPSLLGKLSLQQLLKLCCTAVFLWYIANNFLTFLFVYWIWIIEVPDIIWCPDNSRFYCRWFVDVTGVQSSWLSCVVALPINTDLGWSMWVHGFSLAFWLRLHPTPSPPQSPDLYSDSSQSDTWCTDTGQYFHLHRYLRLLRAYSPTIVFFLLTY